SVLARIFLTSFHDFHLSLSSPGAGLAGECRETVQYLNSVKSTAERNGFCATLRETTKCGALERLKKYCSHSAKENERAVFLVFGFVSAQLQGFANLLLRRSLAENQKSSLRIGYSIFLTALVLNSEV